MGNSTATQERCLKLAGDLEVVLAIGQEEKTLHQFHDIIEVV